VFSGSAQLPSGIVSSSAQTIANLPSGVVSGSAQTIANLPSGTVSGSSQILNGTGFVKTTGASITYDNSTYLTTGTASSTYLPLTGGTLTGPLAGTTSAFTGFAINATPTSAGTGATFVRYINAGSDWYIGSESSVAGNFFGGASAYASVFFGTNPFQFITAGVKRFEIATGGVTSTVGFTGTSAIFSSSVAATTLTLSTTTADYAATITNVQDSSQGLLVRATDNDGSLYLLNLQSSGGATSQTWIDRFAVTKQGNVGIGYSDPQYSLQVNGAIGLRANSQNIKAITGTGWGYSPSTYKVVMIGDTANNVTVSIGYDPSGNSNSAFNGGGGEVLFRNGASFATPTTANTAFHLNTLVLKDGNVLFGTTNADIGGSALGTIIRSNGTISAAINMSSPANYTSPVAADRMNTAGDGLMYGMWRQGIFQAGIGATSGQDMYFYTGDGSNSSQPIRMTIKRAGDVGIGIINPLQTTSNRTVLTINGVSSNVLNFGIGGTLSGYIYNDAATTGIYAQGNLYLQADGANFTSFTNNGLERMRISNVGSVFYKGYFGSSLMGGFSVIGTLSAANTGNRYLHVKINTIANMMYWIKIFGYVYTTTIIEGMSGGYIGGGTGAVNQTFANGNIVTQYQNNGFLEIVVDTINASTTNRWGSITFLGGTDTIASVIPLEIMAYSWTASTTMVY
jgi:hypothetical protein